MKLSELFGKEIFSIYEGEVVATISGASFNNLNNKIKLFYVFDLEENEYELPIRNIRAMSDVVVINNCNKLNMYISNNQNGVMFKTAINNMGKNLGKIIDAEIDINGNVIYFLTNLNNKIEPKNMLVRKSFIYFSEEQINLTNIKPKQQKIKKISDIKVNILNHSLSQNYSFLPTKTIYNSEIILGKTTKDDIYGINNELIAKANQIITEKIIADATKHNRLNQLYFSAT